MTISRQNDKDVQPLFGIMPKITAEFRSSVVDGTSVTVEHDGKYVEIPLPLTPILEMMDGAHSVQDFAVAAHKRTGRILLLEIIEMIAALANAGFLCNAPAEIEQFKNLNPYVPEYKPPKLSIKSKAVERIFALDVVFPATVIGFFLCALGLFASALSPQTGNPILFNFSGIRLFAPLLWGAFAVSALWREISRALALQAVGCKINGAGFALRAFCIPGFYVDVSDIAMAGSRGRIALSLSSIASPLVMVGVALYAGQRLPFASPFVSCVIIASAATLAVSLSPFFNSDFARLAQSVSRNEELRLHGVSYLTKKMLSGLFKPLPKGEMQAVFGYALYVISWLAGAFHLTGLAFRRFSPQVSSLFQTKETLDYVSGAVLLALLVLPMLAAGLTAAFFIARMIFHPITGSISPLLRRKPQNRPLWGEEGPDLLASQPLLQVFSVEEMEQIAKHINVRAYQAGDVVVKQGEPGSEFFIIAEGEAVVEYERPSGAVEKVARLSFGDGFGEIALLQDCVRTATVRAAKPLSVLAMSKDSFNYMVNKADSGGKRFTSLLRRLQLLHGVKFMSGLSPSQLYRLASSSEEIWAAEGDTIISQGDQNADSFYIIKEGEVKAVIDGKEVGRLKQGDYFGEIALIANVPRTATIVATQKTTLLSITRAQFIELALSNVEFGSMLEMKARTRAQWKGVV